MGDITHGEGERVHLDGIDLYVEVHGSGRPLVLLHGGLMSGEMFGPALAAFAATRRVYLPDLQGHGRTGDVDRPLDAALMADDIAGLIEYFELEQPDVVGFSLGGGVAWHVGFRHPDKIRRLVTTSAAISRQAHYPDMLAQQEQVGADMAPFMEQTPMYQIYQQVAPRPEDFGVLLDKAGAAMQEDFDFSDQVRGLQVPTLVMAADADMAPPSHYVEVFGLLGGGQQDGGWDGSGRPAGGHALAIIPGTTHYDITDSPLYAAAILEFLDRDL